MFSFFKGLAKAVVLVIFVFVVTSVYSSFSKSVEVIGGGQTFNQPITNYQDWRASEEQITIIKYGRKAMAFAVNTARPILKEMGIEIQGTYTEDTDEITRQVENATRMLNESTKSINF